MRGFSAAAIHSQPGVRRRPKPRSHRASVFSLVALGIVAAGALAYVAFLLWPRWPTPDVALDAPSVPVSVAGVTFNVPPAAIRIPLQRRPGAQPRLDIAFRWPDLTPPLPADKSSAPAEERLAEQLFLTVVPADGMLPLEERIKTIYSRYVAERAFEGPQGLTGVAFRDDTPYKGEDLFYLPGRTESFFARCTRDNGRTAGACLLERRIGETMLTTRFPRAWLNDWQNVSASVDRLIASMRGRGR